MILLKAIDVENFWEVVSLTLIKKQSELVVSNAVSIAQAYVQSECIPLAIYSAEVLVGFIMYWDLNLMDKYSGKSISCF